MLAIAKDVGLDLAIGVGGIGKHNIVRGAKVRGSDAAAMRWRGASKQSIEDDELCQ